MPDKLLPCPWCKGNESSLDDLQTAVGTVWAVQCPLCDRAVEGKNGTKEGAIAAWNALPRHDARLTAILDKARAVCAAHEQYNSSRGEDATTAGAVALTEALGRLTKAVDEYDKAKGGGGGGGYASPSQLGTGRAYPCPEYGDTSNRRKKTDPYKVPGTEGLDE